MEKKYEKKDIDAKFQEIKGWNSGTSVEALIQPDMKDWYTSLVLTITDINGSEISPGPMSSYIPQSCYYQLIKDPARTAMGDQADLFELVLNYVALGKGIAGFLGAGVRAGYRHLLDIKRETTIYTTIASITAIATKSELKSVADLMRRHSEAYTAAKHNVASFLVQAGANLIKMTHHWSADAHKEYTSMIKVMGLQDIVSDDQLRPLVYLSVHPCPLGVLEAERSKARNNQVDLLIETVAKRKDATPAGFGAAGACYAAANSLLAEEFATPDYWEVESKNLDSKIAEKKRIGDGIPQRMTSKKNQAVACQQAAHNLRVKVAAFVIAMNPVFLSPVNYCVLAHAFGAERKSVDLSPHTGIMCFLAAYIYTSIRGTLAKSPALKKFRSEHSVRVTKAQDCIENFEGTGTLAAIMASV